MKKYKIAKDEIESGKGFIARDADDLISQLDAE